MIRIMAACTPESLRLLRLEPFERRWAERVAGWITSPREAYWLAPRTRAPIRPQDVCEWEQPGHEPLLLFADDGEEPLGYGELNELNRFASRYWLGHLMIAPERRGRGLGTSLARLLLRRAFIQRAARHVSLVVFPANEPARRSYAAAGLREDGCEVHEFPLYGRTEILVRMVATGLPRSS